LNKALALPCCQALKILLAWYLQGESMEERIGRSYLSESRFGDVCLRAAENYMALAEEIPFCGHHSIEDKMTYLTLAEYSLSKAEIQGMDITSYQKRLNDLKKFYQIADTEPMHLESPFCLS
jgi:hypothetical protein